MIKLMKYLKKSAGYIVLIIALLFLQAYCDLSLPDYTSKIINVGIQQKGIEDSVPDKLRDSTLQNLQIFMDEDQKKEVSQNYTQEEDTWVLNDDISKETRENLNEDFSKAMMMVSAFSEDSEQGQAMVAQMGLPEGTDPLTALAQMPEEAVQQIMSQVDEKLKDMPESIVTQAGVAFVASEYEALGKDVDAIQMHYILMSGIRMLAMALVIMLAAISVTFISARVAGRLGHDLRNSIYRKVMSFSSREYHKFSTASLITRSTNDVQQVQQSTGCNGDQIDIGKELAPFQLCRALQAGTGMGPEQHQLYNDKGAGVDNIFLTQQGLHNGNDQRGGIAVNDIDLLHGVQLESFAEQRIQKQKYNVHSNGDAHGIKQPGADLRCILDLKGVQNDTGHDQIDKDHRQHLAVRCLQQAGFHNGISHQQNQK